MSILIRILYASEIGTAEAIANSFYETLLQKELTARLIQLSRVFRPADLINSSVVFNVFVVSTTGDGDPPECAAKFFRLLKSKTLSKNFLTDNFKFTMLALGDSNYSSFCGFGNKLNNKLLSLGGVCFYPVAFADDAVGTEETAEPWIDGLLKFFLNYVKENQAAQIHNSKTQHKDAQFNQISTDFANVSVVDDNTDTDNNLPWIRFWKTSDFSSNSTELLYSLPRLPQRYLRLCFNDQIPTFSPCPPNPLAATESRLVDVVSVSQLTDSRAVKKALLFELDISTTMWLYEPGDSLGVIAENPRDEVERLIQRLNLSSNMHRAIQFSLDSSSSKAELPKHFHSGQTLEQFMTRFVEIRMIPTRQFLYDLSFFCSDETDSKRLRFLAARENQHSYNALVHDPRLCLLDILHHTPSCMPALQVVLEHLPVLRPRPYSVASSMAAHPGRVQFLFKVVEFPQGFGRTFARQGIATGFLDKLASRFETDKSARLSVYMRTPTSFRLPQEVSKPLIMIGPGAGIAPFMGFLELRESLASCGECQPAECHVFFGCRHETLDFLFRTELEGFYQRHVLTGLHVAFSRSPASPFRYVQDRLAEQASVLARILYDTEGFLFVCGDAAKMGPDVMRTVREILMAERGLTLDEAKEFVRKLRKEKRYVEDVWT